MKNIGELLKNIMEEKNLTVEDLCVLLDLYENEVKEGENIIFYDLPNGL